MYNRIDWVARLNNLKNEFGNQIEKILYSGNFNQDLVNRIESVYFEQDLSEGIK